MTALVSSVWYAWGSGRRAKGRQAMAAQAKRTDRETETETETETAALARVDLDALREHRLRNWRQTHETRVRDVEDAAGEPARLKLVTIYPVSAEVPNFYHAFMGDPGAKTAPKWTTPPGRDTPGRCPPASPAGPFLRNARRRRPRVP